MPDSPLPKRVTILGCGQMGLVCTAMLAQSEHAPPSITVWGHNPDEIGALAQTRTTTRLPDFMLDPGVQLETDDRDALNEAELIVSAVPTQHTREAWARLRPHVPPHAAVISVAKGIENTTLLRPSQIIADSLGDDQDGPPRPIGCLSGPTIAAELARCLPATMIAAADDQGFAGTVQRLFTTKWMRIYTNPDLLGVEVAGATKNVIAIAAGVLDGLQAGANAKSALLARGLAEIARLGSAMGASSETFFGIAGVGDLATTCFSPFGRNRSCGEALGKGQSLAEYIDTSPYVVEGVATTRSVVKLAEKFRVEMPITRAVHAVLFEGLDPLEAITSLMTREMRGESLG